MNTPPKVTVIIPVYNAEKYLRECLDSVLSQTWKDMEILCVDDGSTDSSPAILREYAKRDPRLRVLCQENRNAGAARNTGMDAAQGEYLVFLDADDFFEPELLEKQVEQCGRHRAEIGICGADQYDVRTGGFQPLYAALELDASGASGTVIPGKAPVYQITGPTVWNKIFRTEYIRDHGIRFQDTRRANDVFFVMAALGTAKTVAFRKEILVHYRVGQTTNIQSNNRESPGDFIQAFLAVKRYLEDAGVYRRLKESFQKNVLDGSVYNLRKLWDDEERFLTLKRELTDEALPALGVREEGQICDAFVEEWAAKGGDEDNAADFDKLLRLWSPADVIPRIAKRFWNKRLEAAERLTDAASVRVLPRKVKRIGVYYHCMTIGGVENAISRLLPLWLSMGYECVLITDEPPRENDYPVPEGVERVVIPSAFAATAKNYSLRAEALEQTVREQRLDTVVYHAWVDACILWDVLLLKAMDVAVIVHCHGVFSHLLRLNDPLWGDIPAVYRFADGVVTLSDVDRYFWSQLNPRVFTVVNPVSPELRSQSAAALEDPVIVWVGRLSDEKRPTDAIRILHTVRRAVPEARLTMVGDNGINETYIDRVKEFARDLGEEDAVTFTGFQKDVSPYYRSASVFLSTSDFEGFSLTLMEAGAAGLPCVIYRLPYLTLVRGNRGIVSVDTGDETAAAQAIADLLRDPVKRKAMGAAAREHVRKVTDFDYAGAWNGIFSSLEQENPGPPIPEDGQRMWSTLLTHYRDGEERKNGKLDRLRQRYTQENEYYKNELALVKQSFSFRLGQLITWPARKVRTFVRCWKENGFRYTMRVYFLQRNKA